MSKKKPNEELYLVAPGDSDMYTTATSLKEAVEDGVANLVFSLSEAQALAKDLLEDSDTKTSIVYKVDLIPLYEAKVALVRINTTGSAGKVKPTDMESSLKDL